MPYQGVTRPQWVNKIVINTSDAETGIIYMYSANTRSIPMLLMPWLLALPGHLQPWFWQRVHAGKNGSLSSTRKDFIYLHHLSVERKGKWQEQGLAGEGHDHGWVNCGFITTIITAMLMFDVTSPHVNTDNFFNQPVKNYILKMTTTSLWTNEFNGYQLKDCIWVNHPSPLAGWEWTPDGSWMIHSSFLFWGVTSQWPSIPAHDWPHGTPTQTLVCFA